MNLKRVAIYCRVSTREQAQEGYSIEMQKRKCLQYLSLFDIDYTSVEYYCDEGKSAKNLDRPAMNKMKEDLNLGFIDTIIIYKLDRLSRNIIDMYSFIENLIDNNINLICVVDNIDISSANGRFVIGCLSMIAHWERENCAERTTDALIQMCKERKYPLGYTPLGYTKDENKRLTINNETKPIIESIFELAIKGEPMTSISMIIKEKYDFFINGEGIKKIITKPLYYGEFEFKNSMYNDIVPAIITKKTFDMANKMVRKQFKTKVSTNFLLYNKVRCTCGDIMIHETTLGKGKRFYYYWCKNCNKRINQNTVFKVILKPFLLAINESNKNTLINNIYNKLLYRKKSISKLENRSTIDIENIEKYLKKINQFTDEIEELENKLVIMKKYKNYYKDEAWWNNLDLDLKKEYIKEYIKYIEVDFNDNNKIKLNFN